MKVIRLFCTHGFSTNMLRNKMEEAAKKMNLDYKIEAFPYSEVIDKGKDSDVILLGPQIRYNLKHVQKKYPDKTVLLLDMENYAKMNGEAAINQVKIALGD